MGSPFSTIRSKLDRAVVAYLVSKGVAPYIVPARWSGIVPDMKLIPVWMTVRAHAGTEEVLLSGVFNWHVEIAVHGPATPPVNSPNPGQRSVDLDQVFAAAVDALMMSGNGQDLQATADAITAAGNALATTGTAQSQANNADMAQFTCQYWYPPVALDGGNPRGADSTVWKEIAVFRAIASPSIV